MKYPTGLVVGKFCPLHKGHEYVISTALEQCEKVIVLSYTSEHYPGFNAATRERWLSQLLVDQDRLEIHVIDHMVHVGVKNDAPDEAHRRFCADYLFETLETTVQVVFTSEDYGQGFADFLSQYFTAKLSNPMTVDHVMIDYYRSNFPVSGTALRAAINVGNYEVVKEMTPQCVHQSIVRKILFLGAESTGKSTIVTALARNFKTEYAREFGREFYDMRGGKLQYEDMIRIGKGQLDIENRIVSWMEPNQYLFCDTSPLTTLFYCREWFGRVPSKLTDLVWNCDHQYHKIYLCAPDFPMVQDGTRQDEVFRKRGHDFYLDELRGGGQDYTLLTGSLEERINKVTSDLTQH